MSRLLGPELDQIVPLELLVALHFVLKLIMVKNRIILEFKVTLPFSKENFFIYGIIEGTVFVKWPSRWFVIQGTSLLIYNFKEVTSVTTIFVTKNSILYFTFIIELYAQNRNSCNDFYYNITINTHGNHNFVTNNFSRMYIQV